MTAPTRIDAADVGSIVDTGWEDDGVTFACLVASPYAFVNRRAQSHGTALADRYARISGKRLADDV